MPTADINGPQRRVLSSSVKPVKSIYGNSGLALGDAGTLPFKVTRQWVAPAGYYPEQWFLVDPETREVLYESRPRQTLIMGLQAPTELIDTEAEPVGLAPGTYLIVFSLGGLKGGEIEVKAAPSGSVEAA